MLIPLLLFGGLLAAAYAGSRAIAKESPLRALPPSALNPPPGSPSIKPHPTAPGRPRAPMVAAHPQSPTGRAATASRTAAAAARQATGALTEARKRAAVAAKQIATIAKKAAMGEASVPECVAGLAWHSGKPGFSSASSPFYKGLAKHVGEVKADQILSKIRARRALGRAKRAQG